MLSERSNCCKFPQDESKWSSLILSVTVYIPDSIFGCAWWDDWKFRGKIFSELDQDISHQDSLWSDMGTVAGIDSCQRCLFELKVCGMGKTAKIINAFVNQELPTRSNHMRHFHTPKETSGPLETEMVWEWFWVIFWQVGQRRPCVFCSVLYKGTDNGPVVGSYVFHALDTVLGHATKASGHVVYGWAAFHLQLMWAAWPYFIHR